MQSLLEMAKDLVNAQIEAGHLTLDDTHQALVDTHAQLMTLQTRENPSEPREVLVTRYPSGSINWRGSITKYVITCLECGIVSKQLSI